MLISVEEALTLIEGSKKYEHSLLVSRIMKNLSKRFNMSEQVWALVGLLHDLDYDLIDDFSQHGILASLQLKGKLPNDAIHAIQSHDHRTEIKPESLLDKALIFADCLALVIVSKGDINEELPIFKKKPWLKTNLLEFADKHEFDFLEIIEQLSI